MKKFIFDMDVTRENIRNRRLELNLDQTQLSKRAGMSKESVSRYERENYRIPKIDALCLLADALECEPDYLLGRIDYPKRSTSDIAEKLPLRRDAIESLERMKHQFDDYSDFETAFLGYHILSDIIIHIERCLEREIIDGNGKIIEYDDFLTNLFDMLSAYESITSEKKMIRESKGTPFEMDEKSYKNQRLTIRGTSSWLGNDIAAVIRQSVKKYADPDNIVKEEA